MREVEVAGVPLLINEREDWQLPSQPVQSSNPFDKSIVEWCVAHWPGANDNWRPPDTVEEVIQHLRMEQNDYLTNRGFSLGYGFVISQTPFPENIWEVRGFDFRMASNNGDKPPFNQDNFNKFSISIQFEASVAFPITDDQKKAGRYLLLHCDEVIGRKLILQGHLVSDFTTCPGDVILDWLPEMAVRPRPSTNTRPRPKDSDTMLRAAKLEGAGSFWVGNGTRRWHVAGEHEASLTIANGLIDAKTAHVVFDWDEVGTVGERFLNRYVGRQRVS